MKQISSFLKLIRIGNLLIMLTTLVLARFCLTDSILFYELIDLKFSCLLIATMLTAASGNMINDYFDVKIDLVNKPQKVIVGKAISRRVAMLLHLCFSAVAIILGLLINTKVALAIFICAMLLWLYSTSFKKQLLIGNITIALLSAFVIFILYFFDTSTSVQYIFMYSIFAFIISFEREMIKDIEDIKGDKRFDCKTFPIVFGIIKAKKVLIITNLFFILLLAGIIFNTSDIIHFKQSKTELIYQIYLGLLVIIPLVVIIFLTKKARIKKDFSRLSLLTKLVMLTGILSVIFFRY